MSKEGESRLELGHGACSSDFRAVKILICRFLSFRTLYSTHLSPLGGLDKQIEELVEAIVLPMQQEQKFKNLGIRPPKGALMYGPPGEFPN